MTINGTLETFNLRELLQMLAFNQKVGTLRLETEGGARTIYVGHGRASLFTLDAQVSESMVRLLKRGQLCDPERLQRAFDIARKSGRFVGDVLVEMGILTEEMRAGAFQEVLSERLFHAQLTAVNRFEFLDGESIGPNGPDTPIEPSMSVDGLLLELTRRLDQWQAVQEVIPSILEVFEGTGQSVDLVDNEEVDPDMAALVVPCIDGYRNLEQLAEASNVDLFHVAQIVAALLEGGGVRPVPTDDVVARADERSRDRSPQDALPLLRLAIERGDAPDDTRLRLAGVLEQCGEADDAASELEAYAALNEDRDPSTVFDALRRALALRGNDVPTSARLCDYYLSNRSRLRSARSEGLDALRRLIQAASTEGRPLEAAHRLAGFIENGEAPSEDLLILADLYVASNRPQEAASALSQRAEDLLVAGRIAPARDLFRRALQCDPTLTGARRRLQDIDGERRRLAHRRRVQFTLVLFSLVASTIGILWWSQSNKANAAISQVQHFAEAAVERAETEGEELIGTFKAFLNTAAEGEFKEGELNDARNTLLRDVDTLVEAPQKDLARYAAEVERMLTAGTADSHHIIVRGLELQLSQIKKDAVVLVNGLSARAQTALKKAEAHNLRGNFREAYKGLRLARNLGFADPPTRERANQLLHHVSGYMAKYATAKSKIDAHIEAGEFAKAFAGAVAASRQLLDSDLAKDLPFPVQISSEPTGAQVWLGRKDTGLITPCVLKYTAYAKDTTLNLRLAGHRAGVEKLPSYADIRNDEIDLTEWPATVRMTLTAGPRWISPSQGKDDLDFWMDEGLPVVLRSNGRTVQSLNVDTGVPNRASTSETTVDIMRMGGRWGDGTEWRIRGQRTLWVLPKGGPTWKSHAIGRLERRPALAAGVVCVVDTTGTIYGYDVRTGKELWRRTLNGTPTQRPYTSSLGFVIGTHRGHGYRVDPKSGEVADVAPAAQGHALVVPLGRGVLFLGGGERGVRVLRPDGVVEVLGDASPSVTQSPWVTADGVAWIEDGRAHWISSDATTPQTLQSLGSDVAYVGGGSGLLIAVDSEGLLVAIDPAAPDSPYWKAPLGRTPRSVPQVQGRSVFILVDGGLAAVDR